MIVTAKIATTPAADVRALIAREWLRPDDTATPRLGDITLHPHQRVALGRLRAMLTELGGAMLADDVGLGKTFVALALAREAAHPLVIAPAALRAMWRAAASRAATTVTVISYESLSRGTEPPGEFDLVILDEAHHARTPNTARYRAITRLVTKARVLLLSATPIHNRRRDLLALFALFLGARAHALEDESVARCIVRRERSDVSLGASLPELAEPEWLATGDDEPLLEQILALPPALPPRDAGDGGALLAVSLVRQWASSRAALAGTLRRRLARASALSAALEAGRYPSRGELASWLAGDDAVQLGFAELLAPADIRSAALLRTVNAHAAALHALLRRVTRSFDVDVERVRTIIALRTRHTGERIIAFSHSAATVRMFFHGLRGQSGVAALTARGGLVASGAISRRATIERFAPAGSGVGAPRAIERIDLLITTDLLSEGVNLQDASIVVHLDLPWTPARLAQRVGRSRRLGAMHDRTVVYALAPPASAEAMLRAERRLRAKAAVADHALGRSTGVLPPADRRAGPSALRAEAVAMAAAAAPEMAVEMGAVEMAAVEMAAVEMALAAGTAAAVATPESTEVGLAPVERTAVEWRERLAGIMALWACAGKPVLVGRPGERASTSGQAGNSVVLVATIRSPWSGMLALVHDGERHVLLASAAGETVSDDARQVVAVADRAGGGDVPIDHRALTDALSAVDAWLARRSGRRAAGDINPLVAAARRQALRRIARITARSRRDRRPALAALAARARQVVAAPFGIGAERVLRELVAAPEADEPWLRAVSAFGDAHLAPVTAKSCQGIDGHGDARVVALLILQAADPSQ